MIRLVWLLPLAALALKAEPDLRPVDHVDLPRYMGEWHLVAHIPNLFERNKFDVLDRYALLADGTIDDTFVYHRGSADGPLGTWHGTGRVVAGSSNALWRIRIFGPITAGYRLLELDPGYRWAVVSSESGKLFWILSRDAALPDEVYRAIVAKLAIRGLEVQKLVKMP